MSASTSGKTWSVAPLRELCRDVRDGLVGGPFGSDLTCSDYQQTPGVPVIRGSNLGGDTGEFIDDGFVFISEQKALALRRNTAAPGDIIFTQRGTLGQIALIPSNSRFRRYVISQSQMRMTPDTTRVEPRFLFHFFRSPKSLREIASRALTTGVPHINLGILRQFPVTLPPLTEQRRIAAILDKADALRAKRKVALQRTASLPQSVFIEMFGDPATNPRRWRSATLAEIADRFSDGPFGSNLKTSHYRASGARVIRLQNIGRGEFIDKDRAFIDEDHFEHLRKHECIAGDVVVGTLGDPNLRACLVPDHLGHAINKADCVQIRVRPQQASAAYVCALLNHPSTLRMAQDYMHGQTRIRISMGQLRQLVIPIPPLDLQKQFEARVESVDSWKRLNQGALAKAGDLFSSLQHRALSNRL